MAGIWSPEEKCGRNAGSGWPFLRAQRDLGVPTPDGVIEALRGRAGPGGIWPASRPASGSPGHDVKARIEEFVALAGHEHIHKAMT